MSPIFAYADEAGAGVARVPAVARVGVAGDNATAQQTHLPAVSPLPACLDPGYVPSLPCHLLPARGHSQHCSLEAIIGLVDSSLSFCALHPHSSTFRHCNCTPNSYPGLGDILVLLQVRSISKTAAGNLSELSSFPDDVAQEFGFRVLLTSRGVGLYNAFNTRLGPGHSYP